VTRPKKKQKRLTMEQMIDLLDRLDARMQQKTDDDITFADYATFKSDLQLLVDNKKMFERFEGYEGLMEFCQDMIEQMNSIMAIDRALMQIKERWPKVVHKAHLREERPATNPEPVMHLCVKCGKRERRIDEYCKRCADELGIRPKGKI
jgi:hypothetical protein